MKTPFIQPQYNTLSWPHTERSDMSLPLQERQNRVFFTAVCADNHSALSLSLFLKVCAVCEGTDLCLLSLSAAGVLLLTESKQRVILHLARVQQKKISVS